MNERRSFNQTRRSVNLFRKVNEILLSPKYRSYIGLYLNMWVYKYISFSLTLTIS